MKKFLTYFALLLITTFTIAFSVLYYVENTAIQTSKMWLEAEEEKVIESEIRLINEEVSLVLSDLEYLKHNLINSLALSRDYECIGKEWQFFAQSRDLYDQIRFIDVHGYEQIRVNYDQGDPITVPKEALQFKGDRYYFSDSIDLGDGQLYISPLDLNIENGQVELPRKPMIRLATPLIIEGETQGIIIVNYLAQKYLDEFQSDLDHSSGLLYLVNEDGYYLSSANQKKNFAFMFESSKELSFSSDFPEIWTRIRLNGGRVVSGDGLFTTRKLDFNQEILKTADEQIVFKEDAWYIISFISNENENYYFVQPSKIQVFRTIVNDHKVLMLSLAVLSIFIAGLIHQNARSYSQIRYLSEYDSMTGVLNRRAGLNSLQELLRTFDERAGRMYLCYMDVDGLKQVNDYLGHSIGDELILSVVKVIRDVIRESDLFIRLGGDEFLLVLHHMDKDVHESVWKRIQSELNIINSNENRQYIIRVSKGFVEVEKDGTREISDLMKKADERMYVDKEKHRGTVLKNM